MIQETKQENDDAILTIKLRKEEIQIVLNGLGELKAKYSNDVINNIKYQYVLLEEKEKETKRNKKK